jgi:hypothetical protein
MADLYPVAGSKLYIGGVLETKNEDFVESDFASQSWTEIDGWSQMGAVGDAAQTITTPLINRNRDLKQKGTSNAGSMQNTFAALENDAGQIALLAAAEPSNKSNYAFRIDLSNGAKRYFVGLVTTAQDAGGEANTMGNMSATIEINSNIVRVAAV